jgi:hypothetical protein
MLQKTTSKTSMALIVVLSIGVVAAAHARWFGGDGESQEPYKVCFHDGDAFGQTASLSESCQTLHDLTFGEHQPPGGVEDQQEHSGSDPADCRITASWIFP